MGKPSKKQIEAMVKGLKGNADNDAKPKEISAGKISDKKSSMRIRKQASNG